MWGLKAYPKGALYRRPEGEEEEWSVAKGVPETPSLKTPGRTSKHSRGTAGGSMFRGT